MFFLSRPPGRHARHCRLRCDAELDHVKYLWTQSWRCKAIKHPSSEREPCLRVKRRIAPWTWKMIWSPCNIYGNWTDTRLEEMCVLFSFTDIIYLTTYAIWFTFIVPSNTWRNESVLIENSSLLHLLQVWWAASDLGWVVGHSYICYGPLLHGNSTILYEVRPCSNSKQQKMSTKTWVSCTSLPLLAVQAEYICIWIRLQFMLPCLTLAAALSILVSQSFRVYIRVRK